MGKNNGYYRHEVAIMRELGVFWAKAFVATIRVEKLETFRGISGDFSLLT